MPMFKENISCWWISLSYSILDMDPFIPLRCVNLCCIRQPTFSMGCQTHQQQCMDYFCSAPPSALQSMSVNKVLAMHHIKHETHSATHVMCANLTQSCQWVLRQKAPSYINTSKFYNTYKHKCEFSKCQTNPGIYWIYFYQCLPLFLKKLFVFRSAIVLIGHNPDKAPGTHKAVNMSIHHSTVEILAINFFNSRTLNFLRLRKKVSKHSNKYHCNCFLLVVAKKSFNAILHLYNYHSLFFQIVHEWIAFILDSTEGWIYRVTSISGERTMKSYILPVAAWGVRH